MADKEAADGETAGLYKLSNHRPSKPAKCSVQEDIDRDAVGEGMSDSDLGGEKPQWDGKREPDEKSAECEQKCVPEKCWIIAPEGAPADRTDAEIKHDLEQEGESQRRGHVSSNGEVEGPGTHARWRRGRTISQRPRRQARSASRTPPTIVRRQTPPTKRSLAADAHANAVPTPLQQRAAAISPVPSPLLRVDRGAGLEWS